MFAASIAASNDFWRVIDLANGAVTPIPNGYSTVGDARQAFADNGSLLLVVLDPVQPDALEPLVLWTPASGSTLLLPVSPSAFAGASESQLHQSGL
jgi:hypothetical protein